jgi:5-methylcytosine-specific restriction endonuclease McrA
MTKGIKGFQKGQENPSIYQHPWNFGKHPSQEALRRQSESHMGKKQSEETKLKLSKMFKGIPKPEGFREKVSGKNHHNWKGGKSFQLYGFEWTDLLKHSIRTRDCFVCQICNKNGYDVHHIDYNKTNCNPDNLITLCRSCHMKTSFNREYWMKYFGEKNGK